MKISYCTNCYKRLWQLKQTINHNIAYLEKDNVEWCILAYNDDTIEPYLRQNYAEYIADGRIKVKTHHDDYKPIDGSGYACGYAKALSHAMASGEILFNLDADNFICNAHQHLLELKPDQVLINTVHHDGRTGRVGIYRKWYDKLGGYIDKGKYDACDFITRCIISYMDVKYIDCTIKPIANTPFGTLEN